MNGSGWVKLTNSIYNDTIKARSLGGQNGCISRHKLDHHGSYECNGCHTARYSFVSPSNGSAVEVCVTVTVLLCIVGLGYVALLGVAGLEAAGYLVSRPDKIECGVLITIAFVLLTGFFATKIRDLFWFAKSKPRTG